MKIVLIGNEPAYMVSFRGALIRSLVDAGHDVHAYAPGLELGHADAIRLLGATPHAYPLDRQGVGPLSDARTSAWFVRALRGLRPDLVFAFTIKPLVYGTLAAALTGVPNRFVMVTGVGSAFTQRTTRRAKVVHLSARLLYSLALRRANAVIFQNRDDEDLFRTLGLLGTSRTAQVDGSGIDLAQFPPTPPAVAPMTFTLVARMHGEKGVREFASAARIVRASSPSVRFVLVGPFEDHPHSVQRAEVEGWEREGIIEYRGYLPDVRPVLAQTSVYVLPSYREGTPRSVLEAMAMARPIITTDTPGCRETVREGVNGFLVPARDAKALADSMLRFVREPALVAQMGAASSAYAAERYDVHQVNRTLMSVMGIDSAAGTS